MSGNRGKRKKEIPMLTEQVDRKKEAQVESFVTGQPVDMGSSYGGGSSTHDRPRMKVVVVKSEEDFYMTRDWQHNKKTVNLDLPISNWVDRMTADMSDRYTGTDITAPTKGDFFHYALKMMREMWETDTVGRQSAEDWMVKRREIITLERYNKSSESNKVQRLTR